MLQSIHDNAKGWVAYLIVILISVPFALWGIQEYLGSDGKNIVAEVNGEEIDLRAVQNEVAEQRQRIAQMFGQIPPGFEEGALKKSALESIVNQTLLRQHANSNGYRASAQEVLELIKTIPQFQQDGKFDPEAYRQALAMQGRSAADFEEQLRFSLTNDQFRNAIAETAFLPKSEMERYQSLTNQKRDLEVYTLKIQDVIDGLTISDEQVEKYYKDNANRYQTEEQVKLAYVELNEADLSKAIELSDDDLLAYYNENSDRYLSPAKFKASRIRVAISETQNEEQAKAKADALYNELSTGAKQFADVATSNTDETIFAESGEGLGYINKGIMDAAVEDLILVSKPGDLLQPQKTEAGFEIIKVLDIVPEQLQSFEDAKTELAKDLRKEKSAARYEDLFELLRTTAFENDGSLEPSATAIESQIKTTEFFSRRGGQDIAANPQVIRAAFNPEILEQGRNSSLIEISSTHSVVFRLDAHKKPELKPLAEVKADIETALKKEQGKEQLKTKAEAILAEVEKSGNWTSLGEQAAQVAKHADVTRTDTKVPAHVVQQAFKVSAPAEGKSSYTTVEAPTGDFAIVAITAVKAGDTALDEATIEQFASYMGNRAQGATLQALREKSDVKIYSERLESE